MEEITAQCSFQYVLEALASVVEAASYVANDNGVRSPLTKARVYTQYPANQAAITSLGFNVAKVHEFRCLFGNGALSSDTRKK